MRWQSIMLLLLLVGLALIVAQNQEAVEAPLRLTIGSMSIALSLYDVALALACGWVLVWLAGMLDAGLVGARLRDLRRGLATRDGDLARVKAEAYDRERVGTDEVLIRLNRLQESFDALLRRMDDGFRSIVARSEGVDRRDREAVALRE